MAFSRARPLSPSSTLTLLLLTLTLGQLCLNMADLWSTWLEVKAC